MTEEAIHSHREITLRAERRGSTTRYLTARGTENGGLQIEGQDLGNFQDPIVAPDGEYEWVWEITADNLPVLCRTLDIDPDADVLDQLAAHWSHAASDELERRVRESGLAQLWVL